MIETDEFLEHYGVKGMRWGKRKAAGSGGDSSSTAPKKQSRKERRKERREIQRKADYEKATSLIEKSLKDPEVLIKLNGQLVMTGKEFTTHMSNGGYMNVRTTNVFAELDRKNKTYVMV